VLRRQEKSWLMEIAVVNAFLCSWAIVPENSLDDIKQCATSLGLRVHSIVARVNFPHEKTRGLYQTIGEQSKKALFLLVRQPAKQSPCLASPTQPSGCQAQGIECK
jgi:hypothetical protein